MIALPPADADASVGFADDDPAASFECSLDGARFAAYTSPAASPGWRRAAHAVAVRTVNRWGASAPADPAWAVATTP